MFGKIILAKRKYHFTEQMIQFFFVVNQKWLQQLHCLTFLSLFLENSSETGD